MKLCSVLHFVWIFDLPLANQQGVATHLTSVYFCQNRNVHMWEKLQDDGVNCCHDKVLQFPHLLHTTAFQQMLKHVLIFKRESSHWYEDAGFSVILPSLIHETLTTPINSHNVSHEPHAWELKWDESSCDVKLEIL